MEIGDFGKMLNKFIRMVKKNFIDIRFLSVAVMILLFVSLLVFKPTGFMEGMDGGDGSEDSTNKFKVIDSPAPNVVVHASSASAASPVVSDTDDSKDGVVDPCTECGTECANQGNACFESKNSCLKCESTTAKRMLKIMASESAPTVEVNIFTGGDAGPPGVQSSVVGKGMKDSQMAKSFDGAGISSVVPAKPASYMVGTLNQANTEDHTKFANTLIDNVPEGEVIDASSPTTTVAPPSGTGIPPLPLPSHAVLNGAQSDVDEMNNL